MESDNDAWTKIVLPNPIEHLLHFIEREKNHSNNNDAKEEKNIIPIKMNEIEND